MGNHIVVVDDDRSTVTLLTMLLEMDGFTVSHSARPETVLEWGRTRDVDAFVIDCHLGAYDGLDLLREIRSDPKLEGKLVVTTSGRDLGEEALAAGADLFLLKPFSPTELSKSLSSRLEACE